MRVNIVNASMVAALMLWAWPARAIPRSPEKDQLRAMARMPKMDLQFGLSFDPLQGFAFLTPVLDVPAEIEKLKTALKGEVYDAEKYLRLGRLFQETRDRPKSLVSFQAAEKLYRKQLDLQPGSAEVLCQLGLALAAQGKDSEAETKFRDAVEIAPDSAKAWIMLGRHWQGVAFDLLCGTGMTRNRVPFNRAVVNLVARPPVREKVDQAERWIAEAGRCFDRAVALTNLQARAYAERAMHGSFSNAVSNAIAIMRGDESAVRKIEASCFSEEALLDFQRAARLDPRNCSMIAAAALFEASTILLQGDKTSFSDVLRGEFWNWLPEEAQNRIRQAVTHLEQLTDTSETELAASSCEALGFLQELVFKDSTAAEKSLRRTVELDPARERAWDLLISIVGRRHRYPELVEICSDRLKEKENVRNHLLLAKAYEKVDDLEAAEREVRLAIAQDGANFFANLSLANLLLKRQGGAEAWGVRDALRKAEQNMGAGAGRQNIIDLAISQSIFYALTGDVETARRILKGILNVSRDVPEVKQLLLLVGY